MNLQLLSSSAALVLTAIALPGVFSEEPSLALAEPVEGIASFVDATSDEAADPGRGVGIMSQLRGSSSESTAVKLIFDLEHRGLTGEFTRKFEVQWADSCGRLEPAREVSGRPGRGRQGRIEMTYNGVSKSTPGFRVRAADEEDQDALFIDTMQAEVNGRVLNGLTFERNNFQGYCLSTNTRGRFFFRRCFGDRTYACLDFCANGLVLAVPNCGSSLSECPLLARDKMPSWKLQNADANTIKSASCPPDDDMGQLRLLEVVRGCERPRFLRAYAPPRLCSRSPVSSEPLRVILGLHGFGGRGADETEKWRDVATSLDSIVIAPEGTESTICCRGGPRGWNAVDCCGDAVTNGVDDVEFIDGAVEAFMDAWFGSDIGGRGAFHVIATGFSNGGFMTSLLGLLPGGSRPPWLIGIVPTGGYQYGVELYEGASSLPIMMHHGGRDAIVRPEGCCAPADGPPEGNCPLNAGGGGGPLDIGRGRETCTSVRQAFEMWSRVNGCGSTALDEDAVDDGEGQGAPPFTCWKGVGCAEPANFCLWENEFHIWGQRFPGADMAGAWMEDVFRRAEARGGVGPAGGNARDRYLGGRRSL